ncbi:MAG: hypothetical protein ABIT92_00285 [Gammaproteobacteria bacterium]
MSNLTTNLPVPGKSGRATGDLIERLRDRDHIDPAQLPAAGKLLAFILAIAVMGIMRTRGVRVRAVPPILLLAQRFGFAKRYTLLLKFLARVPG